MTRMTGLCRLGWKLERIERSGSYITLTYSTPRGRRRVRTRSLALTVPAYTAASLLQVGVSVPQQVPWVIHVGLPVLE